MSLKPLGFWGLVVEPNKMYSQTVPVSFKITMASLGPSSQAETEEQPQKGRTVLLVTHDKDGEFALCSLTSNLHDQQELDLIFLEGETIHLRVDGPQPVHLTGYYVDTHGHELSESDYDSQDEELGEGESLGEEDSDEEDEEEVEESSGDEEKDDSEDDSEYDSDFINDDSEDENLSFSDEDDDEEDSMDDSEEEEEDSASEDEERVMAELKKKRAANEPAKVLPPPKKEKKDEPAEAKKAAAVETKIEGKKAVEAKSKGETPSKPSSQPSSTPGSAVKTLPSGLKWEDVKQGEGMKAQKGRRLGIQYTVCDEAGNTLASNRNKELLFFDLHADPAVHKGLHLALNQMHQGGERVITIPGTFVESNAKAQPAIPKGKTVTVRVSLEKVQPSK